MYNKDNSNSFERRVGEHEWRGQNTNGEINSKNTETREQEEELPNYEEKKCYSQNTANQIKPNTKREHRWNVISYERFRENENLHGLKAKLCSLTKDNKIVYWLSAAHHSQQWGERGRPPYHHLSTLRGLLNFVGTSTQASRVHILWWKKEFQD